MSETGALTVEDIIRAKETIMAGTKNTWTDTQIEYAMHLLHGWLPEYLAELEREQSEAERRKNEPASTFEAWTGFKR